MLDCFAALAMTSWMEINSHPQFVRLFLLCLGLTTGAVAGSLTVGELPNCDRLSCNRLS